MIDGPPSTSRIPRPISVRLDISSRCQLSCPRCPSVPWEEGNVLGNGILSFEAFERFLDGNPQIRWLELVSAGEVLLNPHLPRMLEYARSRDVTCTLNEGVNMNHASDEALEALVRCEVPLVRCAIDGVTQETYAIYRRGGDLRKVLANIQKLNQLKARCGSRRPHLIFQFIVFGHNEHEIDAAAALANVLHMTLELRHNSSPDYSPVRDRERVTKLLGAADRRDALRRSGKDVFRGVCHAMWKSPQVNWDGKILGCSNNPKVAYAEDGLTGDLTELCNTEQLQYARRMLMGEAPPRDDLPCSDCKMYKALREHGNWITQEELDGWRPPHERFLERREDETPRRETSRET